MNGPEDYPLKDLQILSITHTQIERALSGCERDEAREVLLVCKKSIEYAIFQMGRKDARQFVPTSNVPPDYAIAPEATDSASTMNTSSMPDGAAPFPTTATTDQETQS